MSQAPHTLVRWQRQASLARRPAYFHTMGRDGLLWRGGVLRRTHAGRCGALRSNGKYCRQPAGLGTDHVGQGLCTWHDWRRVQEGFFRREAVRRRARRVCFGLLLALTTWLLAWGLLGLLDTPSVERPVQHALVPPTTAYPTVQPDDPSQQGNLSRMRNNIIIRNSIIENSQGFGIALTPLPSSAPVSPPAWPSEGRLWSLPLLAARVSSTTQAVLEGGHTLQGDMLFRKASMTCATWQFRLPPSPALTLSLRVLSTIGSATTGAVVLRGQINSAQPMRRVQGGPWRTDEVRQDFWWLSQVDASADIRLTHVHLCREGAHDDDTAQEPLLIQQVHLHALPVPAP